MERLFYCRRFSLSTACRDELWVPTGPLGRPSPVYFRQGHRVSPGRLLHAVLLCELPDELLGVQCLLFGDVCEAEGSVEARPRLPQRARIP